MCYSFKFGCKKVKIYYEFILVGCGMLSNGLYILNLDPLSIEQQSLDINNVVRNKHGRTTESSSMLWRKRLGHISRERME